MLDAARASVSRRVAMVTDLLAPGGAQRQLVMLAAGLAPAKKSPGW